MIDNEQQIDHAEHAAVRAESERENREEQAHADLVTATVQHLRALGTASYLDAQASLARFAEEVRLRLAPNAHRYELLARQQHVALLAPTTASSIEGAGSYDLAEVARVAARAYATTHRSPRDGDLLNRALAHAVARVADAVAEVAHHAQQAATDREVEQHERDLAERDAGSEL